MVARDQIALGGGKFNTEAHGVGGDGKVSVVVKEDERSITVERGGTVAVFSRKSGLLTRLSVKGVAVLEEVSPGVPAGPHLTCVRAFVDNDKWLKNSFLSSGLVRLGYHPEPIAVEGDTVVYETAEGETCRVRGDRILVSVGRRARLQGFGLETLGVELALNPAGRPYGIKVDERMRTSVPGVYAAGDVTGFSMLAHTASREGEVAVNDILGKAIPGVVYTNPEVAGTGLTEAEAIARGMDCQVYKLPMAFSGRFVAENERGEGLCKVVADRISGAVLGVHMRGNPCSEIIQGACIAIEQGMTVGQLKDVVFPHPTVSEILKETLFSLK